MTQGSAPQPPDDDTEEPPEDERPGSAQKLAPPGLPRLLGVFLLVFGGGLVALLAVSVLVVYLIGLTARRVGVPELEVTVTFLSLLAILVVGYVGASLGAELQALGRRFGDSLEAAGERVADEVDESTAALVETIEELPAVIVDPRLASRPPERPANRARRGPR